MSNLNREIISEFAEIFYHQRDVRRAFDLHVSEQQYIQHNPTIANGREAAINALHDKFYPSIGCAPCTRAISLGEDVRSGRWWWESPELKECGLHVKAD